MYSESSPSFCMWTATVLVLRAPSIGWRERQKFLSARCSRADTSGALDQDTNDITFTVNRLDDARTPRVVAEDLAQPADAHVDAPVERPGVAAARELDELAAGDHAVAMRQ